MFSNNISTSTVDCIIYYMYRHHQKANSFFHIIIYTLFITSYNRIDYFSIVAYLTIFVPIILLY
jgi:hypothetical protein